MGIDKQDLLKISKELVSLAASKAASNVSGVNQEKGVKIPQLAWDIQNSVKEAVITAANVAVKAVNIHIQGVMMPREGSKLNG